MSFPIGARFAHPSAGRKGDQELAARHLKPGEVYVVRRLEVGQPGSTLFLDEPGLRDTGFNTVMFEAAELPGFDDDDEGGEPDETEPGMSTAGDLIDYLATQPRDRKVILRKDAEGNGHSPLAEAWEAMYIAESTWSGETRITPEDLAEQMAGPNPNGWSEEDAAGAAVARLRELVEEAEAVAVNG